MLHFTPEGLQLRKSLVHAALHCHTTSASRFKSFQKPPLDGSAGRVRQVLLLLFRAPPLQWKLYPAAQVSSYAEGERLQISCNAAASCRSKNNMLSAVYVSHFGCFIATPGNRQCVVQAGQLLQLVTFVAHVCLCKGSATT